MPSASDAPDDHLPAIRVRDLWVRFSTTEESIPTLAGAVRRLRHRAKRTQEIAALRGVSFDVHHGEVYGVIGRNGAGKSTLFRVLAGILPPSDGEVVIDGRVTPLLSLGIGFNRQLTGHENILIGGLANGLEPGAIAEHYHEIVEFADLGAALHRPMRTYSSGMFARLGFAVATHLEPEILLVDEALSAGDAAFKNKCLDKIVELCARQCTVLIVSHGLQIVQLLARRALWLEQGTVRMEGECGEVIDGYLGNEGLKQESAEMEDL